MIAVAALVPWSVTAVLGVVMLRRWSRPSAVALVHLATAATGMAAWLVYLAADRPTWLGWGVFGWLTLVNVLGDALLVGGWRRRTPEPRPRGVRAYAASAADVLSGRRRIARVHALLAPATYGLVLLAALGV